MDPFVKASPEEARRDLLTRIAVLRIDVVRAAQAKSTPTRVAAAYDVLRDWLRLPPAARPTYKSVAAESVLAVTTSVQRDRAVDKRERLVVEISFLDAGISIGLLRPISKTVRKRRSDLLRQLQAIDRDQTSDFIFTWCTLLRYRPSNGLHRRELFRDDLFETLRALVHLGIPRRAEAVSNAFARELGPAGKIIARHFPLNEEQRRVAELVHRLQTLPPIPLSLIRSARALQRIMEAPLDEIPLVVTERGEIQIGKDTFGAARRPV